MINYSFIFVLLVPGIIILFISYYFTRDKYYLKTFYYHDNIKKYTDNFWIFTICVLLPLFCILLGGGMSWLAGHNGFFLFSLVPAIVMLYGGIAILIRRKFKKYLDETEVIDEDNITRYVELSSNWIIILSVFMFFSTLCYYLSNDINTLIILILGIILLHIFLFPDYINKFLDFDIRKKEYVMKVQKAIYTILGLLAFFDLCLIISFLH